MTFTVNGSANSLAPGTYGTLTANPPAKRAALGQDDIGFNNTTNNQGNTTRVATLIVNPKQYGSP
jgi:hypothetical protein